MTRLLTILYLCLLCSFIGSDAREPDPFRAILTKASRLYRPEVAFPGAEGFGAYTQGGKHGNVIKVTHLNDDGSPGSLRWAVEQNYPRIIEFDVEGTIHLKNDLFIVNPCLTIDGSTAPGQGIVLSNGALIIKNTHDIILRHLRVRPNDEAALKGETIEKPVKQAILVDTSIFVIIDHCSTSWYSEKAISVVGDSDNVTVQWCLIANPEIPQSYGALLSARTVSFIKNLVAFQGLQTTCSHEYSFKEFVNNYFSGYAASASQIMVKDRSCYFHLIGNFFRQFSQYGPETPEITIAYLSEGNTSIERPKIYLLDNLGPSKLDVLQDDWTLVKSLIRDNETAAVKTYKPLFHSIVTPFHVESIPGTIMEQAGATLPSRDAVDENIIMLISQEQ